MDRLPDPAFQTQRLDLIPGTIDLLSDLLDGAPCTRRFVDLADGWTDGGLHPLRYVLDRLKHKQEAARWWNYFPVLRKDKILIGSTGYKGPPDQEGKVEIGYEIAPAYRNQGYATELCTGLVAFARTNQQVRMVQAHTIGEENASTRVLRKCGFELVETIALNADAPVWRWIISVRSR